MSEGKGESVRVRVRVAGPLSFCRRSSHREHIETDTSWTVRSE